MEERVISFVLGLAVKYPAFASVALVIGSLRIFLKPLMALAISYVEWSPDPKDNEKLKKVMESKAYKLFAFALDYLASVKLPK